jgi:hypothetical protein
MTTHEQDRQNPISIPLAELKAEAASVAEAMKSGDASPLVRERFILVRTALFQRGIYDPVLVRFDSYTAPKATAAEVAEQLAIVATNL